MAELADAADLKSADGDIVWVRPPPALQVTNVRRKRTFFVFVFRYSGGGGVMPFTLTTAVQNSGCSGKHCYARGAAGECGGGGKCEEGYSDRIKCG